MSAKNARFNPEDRKLFFQTIYTMLYVAALGGGSMAGSLLWQVFPKGMDNCNDGYQIVLSEGESLSEIILQHSLRLQDLIETATAGHSVKAKICPLKLKCCW
jgi:mannan endo-1,4-beta-mannosidase